jgi:hypothetical protein
MALSLKMSGATPPFSHFPSGCAQGKLFTLTLNIDNYITQRKIAKRMK